MREDPNGAVMANGVLEASFGGSDQLWERMWLSSVDVHPHVVGEFEDGALMQAFGREGVGLFPIPSVIAALSIDECASCDA